ncbi:MAG TPA: adenosylcobinamide-GDP ribazoletransferase [Gemmataceae bacterium]|nr:adenosylcobinamide-GDP ribazoletransferase [Gemmataceae bacterium]
MGKSLLDERRQQRRILATLGVWIVDHLMGCLAAMQFLTIAPALVRRPFADAELGRAVGYFPLIGLLIGGFLVGIDRLLALFLPPGMAVALVLAAWVLCTGALHMDGFLDSCDGLFGGRTPEDRLRILRDERVGAFAVIGGILLLLVKFQGLNAIPHRSAALCLAPVTGRWGMAVAVAAFPYARAEGLGRAMKDHAGWSEALRASAIAIAAALFAAGPLGLIVLLLSGALMFLVARFVLTRLPGLTGDIYGALCELLEVLVLLGFAASDRG